jgi:hypothetical protein
MVHLSPDRIDRKLASLGIHSAADLSRHTPAELGLLLQVDALVYGAIESIRNVAPVLGYYRGLGGSIRMVGATEESPLYFEVSHTERMTGGVLLASTQVVTGIREQIANSSNLALVELADRWTESILDHIPPPENPDHQALQEALRTPEIATTKIQTSRKGPLVAGDSIEIIVTSDHDLDVEGNLGSLGRFTLHEIEPGRYRGRFPIIPGMAGTCPKPTISVTNRHGQNARHTLSSAIEVVARPPDAVSKLTVESGPAGPILHWSPPAGFSSLRYAIYRTPTARPGAWVRIGTGQETTFTDSKAPASEELLYQVLALNDAGCSHPTTPAKYRP